MTDHVLVIDDDPDIGSAVRDALGMDGYRVEVAAHGAAGLEPLGGDPTLILLDMRMPVMDGWTFAHEARQRGSQIPIVVMTAAQDAAAWAGEIDASAYLAKPFSVSDLLEVVARLRESPTDRDALDSGD